MSLAYRLVTLLLSITVAVSSAVGFGGEQNGVPSAENSVLDTEELDVLVRDKLRELKTDESRVSIAAYDTGSGEYYYFNADKWMYSASLYKLPICMTFDNKLKNGELEPNSFSMDDSVILEAILVHSHARWADNLAKRFYGNIKLNKHLREQDLIYSGFDEAQLPATYYSVSYYCARFYLGIIEELYNHQEEYPDLIPYMKQASPGLYLKSMLGERYEIAQKYGSAGGTVGAAGIIFTEKPVLIVIMTKSTNDSCGSRIVGTLAETVTDYITAKNSDI